MRDETNETNPPPKPQNNKNESRVGGGGGWIEMFGCNIHALAIFRITLGFMLLLELLLRFRFLQAFYSDEGTLPRYILLPQTDDIYRTLCLHCAFGSLNAQRILLSVQCLFATTLSLGYYTRFSAIVSWFLYLSLTLRNTWLNFILDRYFHYLLFYSMFLPSLDAVWSVDAFLQQKRQDTKDNNNNKNSATAITTTTIINPATIALKLQILWIYMDAGYGKYADPLQGWTFHADPLPALDTYVRHTIGARYLYSLLGPFGLRLMTPTVVYAELGCPIVALLASYLGWENVVFGAVVLICTMHVGIAITIRNTVLLSLVACVAWMVYLPPSLFQQQHQQKQQQEGETKKSNKKYHFSLVTLVPIAAFVSGSIWFETVSKQCDQSMEHVWSTLLHNRWNVFVGAEEYVTWEIAPGRLADGSVVDIWSKSDTINWNMPGSGAPCTSTSRPGRWRSYPYLAELEGEEGQVLWDYLCYEWDNEHGVLSSSNNETNGGKKLLRFNFFMLQADVLPEMWFSSTRKRLIHSHVCPGVENEGGSNVDDYSFLKEEL